MAELEMPGTGPLITAMPERLAIRAIVAAGFGSALEHYDLAIYGFMALSMSQLFFPSSNAGLSLLATYGSYGVAFLMRPLGAALLGSYADRRGRKAALTLSLGLMGLGSAAIAILPTYQQAGMLAPIGLILARLLQGFSGGGEGGSSAMFLAEQHPERRGEYASWLLFAGGLTGVLAAGSGWLLNNLFTPDEVAAWAWRLPFVFGVMVYPVGIYIRRRTAETVEFRRGVKSRRPIRDTFTRHPWLLVAAICLPTAGSILIYLTSYMANYSVRQLHLSIAIGFVPGIVGGIAAALIGPLFGRLSDRVGRFRLMLPSVLVIGLASWPLFAWLVREPTLQTLVIVQIVLSGAGAAYAGASAGLLAELFPVGNRVTAAALSIAICLTLFGGSAQFVFEFLADATGNPVAPSFYIVFGAVLSMAALLALRWTNRLR